MREREEALRREIEKDSLAIAANDSLSVRDTLQLDSLRQSSVEPSETIPSPRSAYFVSYCDGYEEQFSEANLDSITIEMIENATDRKLTDSNIVGKLVDGYTWHLAVIADNSKKMYAIGDKVKLRFGSSADICSAEISDIRDEGESRSLA